MKKEIRRGERGEIDRPEKRVTTSRKGLTVISRKGKPIREGVVGRGYVYLVIDCSESMAGSKLEQAKRGAIDFAERAQAKGYRIGLVQFESSAKHVCNPVGEVSVLDRYVQSLEIGGATNMAEAIQLATRNLRRRRGARSIVIVTDGMPNIGEPTGKQAALRSAREAKRNNTDIITIGTDDAEWEFLKKIATRDELATFTSRESLAKAVASTAKMLPRPE